jgi:hypothetical protein
MWGARPSSWNGLADYLVGLWGIVVSGPSSIGQDVCGAEGLPGSAHEATASSALAACGRAVEGRPSGVLDAQRAAALRAGFGTFVVT